MNFGILHNEPPEVYHASDAVGSHKLNDFAAPNVPLLYYRKYISREAPQDSGSPAFNFGTYFHKLALEGEAAAEGAFVTIPEEAPARPTEAMLSDAKPSESSVARIKWWAEWNLKNAGKPVIDQADKDLAWKMLKAIREKPKMAALFANGKPEVTFRRAGAEQGDRVDDGIFVEPDFHGAAWESLQVVLLHVLLSECGSASVDRVATG